MTLELTLNYVMFHDEQDKLLLNNVMTVIALLRLDRQRSSLLGGGLAL